MSEIVNGLIKALEETLTKLNAIQGNSINHKLDSNERYRALSNLLEQTPCINPEWKDITEEMQAIRENLEG